MRFRADVVTGRRRSRPGADMGDAAAHLAGANDADFFDRRVHLVVTNAGETVNRSPGIRMSSPWPTSTSGRIRAAPAVGACKRRRRRVRRLPPRPTSDCRQAPKEHRQRRFVGRPGQNEQDIGQAVHEAERRRIYHLARSGERHEHAFGPPADGAA